MHLFLRTWLLVPFLTINAWAAGNWKAGSCDTTEFSKETWQQLTDQEPRLHTELKEIAIASGQGDRKEVTLTNCRVEWPVDNDGRPIEGFRTAVLHHIWGELKGSPPSRSEGGMRIVWNTKYEQVQVGSEVFFRPVRKVYGFTICRSQPVCAVLDVLGLKSGETPVPITMNLERNTLVK